MSDLDDIKIEGNAIDEEKIKIGDQEFDPKELQEMVGIAQQVKEVETKYNTKMDRVFPEYIKTTQALKEAEGYKEKYTTLEQQIEQQKNNSQGLTEEQIIAAREQLNIIAGGKLMTSSEFDNAYQQRRQQEKAVEGLLSDVDKLSGIVEKDGKPIFDKKELLEYMDQTGITSPEAAYKIKYEKELDDWKMDKLSKGKRSGLFTVTNSQAGSKQPTDARPNPQNLEAMVSEALSGMPEY